LNARRRGALALKAAWRRHVVESLEIGFVDASIQLAHLSSESRLLRLVAPHLLDSYMARLQSDRHEIRFE
jgi:hypothetical protein